MHGLPVEGTGGIASVGVRDMGTGVMDYQRGRADERKAVHRKIEKMIGQVKRLEIHQSSCVTLQELGIWMDERTNGVTKKFALAAAEALQAECIRQGLMRM